VSVDAIDSVQQFREMVSAYLQFEREVGALMLRLAEEGDVRAATLLLELVRDLQARTGELYLEEGEA
jgi:hypothetical protein